MTEAERIAAGTIVGFDLTVPDADPIRDFYADVVGWTVEPADQGGYSDYFLKSPETGAYVAGVCHARGENADLPPQWIAYIAVPDLAASLERCIAAGGSLLTDVKGAAGSTQYCVIRDPAGAVLALMQVAAE